MRGSLGFAVAVAPVLVAPGRLVAGGCTEHFDSTFGMVQQVVFERHGCTNAA
ncbi:MAG: hypothetical protein ABI629_26425 [bacterium]